MERTSRPSVVGVDLFFSLARVVSSILSNAYRACIPRLNETIGPHHQRCDVASQSKGVPGVLFLSSESLSQRLTIPPFLGNCKRRRGKQQMDGILSLLAFAYLLVAGTRAHDSPEFVTHLG